MQSNRQEACQLPLKSEIEELQARATSFVKGDIVAIIGVDDETNKGTVVDLETESINGLTTEMVKV